MVNYLQYRMRRGILQRDTKQEFGSQPNQQRKKEIIIKHEAVYRMCITFFYYFEVIFILVTKYFRTLFNSLKMHKGY